MTDGPPGTTVLGMLGLRVALTADSAALAAALLEALAWWRGEPEPAGLPTLVLAASLARPDAPKPSGGAGRLAVTGRRLSLDIPGAAGGADAETGRAWCRLAPALAGDPERLGEEVLEPLLLFLLTRSGRIPVHAAGFVLDGRPVLLAGGGGTGKSSLALEAARAGLAVLGDDIVFLDAADDPVVRGRPGPFHVPAAGAGAAGASPKAGLRWRGGRWKQRVSAPGLHPGPVAGPGVLCLLAPAGARRAPVPPGDEGPPAPRAAAGSASAEPPHGPRPAAVPPGAEPPQVPTTPRLTPVPVAAAVAEVVDALEPGFADFRAELPSVLSRFAAGGCWRLALAADPAESLAALLAGLATDSGSGH